MNTEQLLQNRQCSHGDYPSKSEYIQKMKSLTRSQTGWSKLTSSQKESLDNIFQKVGRVITGDNNFKDHWDDISGYATLISEKLSSTTKEVEHVHVNKENFPDYTPTVSSSGNGSVGDD